MLFCFVRLVAEDGWGHKYHIISGPFDKLLCSISAMRLDGGEARLTNLQSACSACHAEPSHIQ